MQTISEVMTRDVRFVSPRESLQRAAQLMDELDVGALPVCDGARLVGMVTDRDITVRGVAAGRPPGDAHVDEVMSSDVRWVFEDQSLDDVMKQMADSRIRRVPVVSHDDEHKLVGIVALGDLATRAPQDKAGGKVEQVVEKVSQPAASDDSVRQAALDGDAAGHPAKTAAHEEGRYSGFAHKDLSSMAPAKGTSAGPGSTNDIGTAAATGLGAASTGAGNTVSSGGIATPTHTNAPARNLEDAAGGPSSPAAPTIKPDRNTR